MSLIKIVLITLVMLSSQSVWTTEFSNSRGGTLRGDQVFEDSTIFGKVYIDRNQNGVQDTGEEGIPGIQLVTATGYIITTDVNGAYTFYGADASRGIMGANFVIKIEPNSVPPGLSILGRSTAAVRVSPGLPTQVDFRLQVDKSED